MLQRIDLRSGLGDLREVLPRAAVDVGAATEAVAPIVQDVRRRGAAAVLDAAARFDGIAPPALRVPAEVIAAAVDALTPAVRDALTESIARARVGHAAQLPVERVTHDRTGRHRHPALGPGAPGRVVRAGRAGAVPVERGDERGAGPGGRGRCHRRDVTAAEGQQRLAGPECAGGLRAARRRRGLRGRRRPGDRAAGARCHRHRRHGDRTGRRDHRAGQRLRHRRQAPAARHGGDRFGSRADRDRRHRRRFRRSGTRCRRPDLAGRARSAGRVGVDHHLGRRWPTRWIRYCRNGSRHTKHHDRVRVALSGSQSGAVLVSSIDDAIAVADAYAAEHLEIQTRDAAVVAGRIRNAGAVFVGPFSPVSLGDYCAGSNHVLPTSRVRPVLRRG